AFKERETHSVIASPLSIAERVLGVVRVESKKTYSFSLDDSRLLRSVCDLGVVVLERANLLRNMKELAIHDPLTGLFLRDYFFSRLKDETHRALSNHMQLGVLMVDVDDFKRINDTHGHIVGDIVLKRVAKVLHEIVGETGNILCRFGGEEFLALIVECNRERVVTIAEQLRCAIEETVVSFRRKDICFTVSIGALTYPADGLDAHGLLDVADKLLYKAKREGKNRVCLYGQ
ncbi:MAG: GGDEF domain-containing protein, partial [Candidatus Omnitrophica bacterium]|nr:GGDEF domain-containing protein [Candidatus Omnitrophota bacterium]